MWIFDVDLARVQLPKYPLPRSLSGNNYLDTLYIDEVVEYMDKLNKTEKTVFLELFLDILHLDSDEWVA